MTEKKKTPAILSTHHELMMVSGTKHLYDAAADNSKTITMVATDPKLRLRWTPELHERFVIAVAQLGGSESKFFSHTKTWIFIVCFHTTMSSIHIAMD